MREAVIVSTARTGLAKSHRGGFNHTGGVAMAGHAIRHSIERAGVDPAEVSEVVLGCGTPQGTTGNNVGRLAAIKAGCPVTTTGMTVSRHCSSGLNAIAAAASRIIVDGEQIVVGAGVESITHSLSGSGFTLQVDGPLAAEYPGLWMPMIETADIVAHRYKISREYQDEYSLESQKRTAAAQEAGLYDHEIVPMETTMIVKDKESGETSEVDYTVTRDECNRPNTTLEGLASLKPIRGEEHFITAGNASQLSDGAASVVLMEASEAKARWLEPLGAFRGFAVAGCEPDEMGIGPIHAVPRLLDRAGLKVDDIDLWELNEAFASQCLYCRDTLGIDPEKYNVNGGSISVGHPFGMTGARCVGHILLEGRRRKAKWGVVTMCIGGGQGAAGLFEIF
ncbi:MAG: acetyl-CoA C-acyltransferase [Deltaproteobacteria bacterium]|nr:acetyl-CoA C-acyltransferase [Deltaproteobacteria bacterium]